MSDLSFSLSSSVMIVTVVEVVQHLLTELVGELLLHFFDLPCFSIVPQSPGHFLVGHFFAVAFLVTPVGRQSFFVFGGELEDALVLVHPPDALAHVTLSEQVQEELVQADFLLVALEKGKQNIHQSCFCQFIFFYFQVFVLEMLTCVFPEGIAVVIQLVLPF